MNDEVDRVFGTDEGGGETLPSFFIPIILIRNNPAERLYRFLYLAKPLYPKQSS